MIGIGEVVVILPNSPDDIDIDILRPQSIDFKDASMAVLIQALKQGTGGYFSTRGEGGGFYRTEMNCGDAASWLGTPGGGLEGSKNIGTG